MFQGHFEFNFTDPGDYDVEVNVIAYFDNSSRSRDSVSLLYDTSKKGLTLRQEEGRPNEKIKMAVFRKEIISKQPIGNMSVVGDKLLKPWLPFENCAVRRLPSFRVFSCN